MRSCVVMQVELLEWNFWHGAEQRCTGAHIFGDAKNVCPNLILFFTNTV